VCKDKYGIKIINYLSILILGIDKNMRSDCVACHRKIGQK